VASASLLAATHVTTGVFNIACGQQVTVKGLANLIRSLTGSVSGITHHEVRQGDIEHSLADISRASSFSWKPTVSMKEGLLRTIEGQRC
ncbi:MAG: hypothetical protein JXA58_06295, partial [Dehalococcoidia bacterium]|nr:hypothetical protein [Dehalococcoidia bacterium]